MQQGEDSSIFAASRVLCHHAVEIFGMKDVVHWTLGCVVAEQGGVVRLTPLAVT